MDASHRGRYSDFDARAGGGGGKSNLTIEPSGSDGHRGFAAESRGSGGSGGKRSLTGSRSIYSLDVDLLCTIFSLLDHFDLVRCSVVCKAWYHVVYTSSLMRDLYEKRNSCIKLTAKSLPLEISTKLYLGELAMEEHKLSFRRASAKVDQWNGHHTRVNICRMKRGVVLSGVGDKVLSSSEVMSLHGFILLFDHVLRLWSAKSCKYMDEYIIPETDKLVDYEFDENKIVGLTNSKLCIWRRHGQRGIFQSHEGVFTRGLCMSYIDPEAVIGCEDGRVRVFDMYSGKCSRIFRVHSGPVTCLALTDDQLIIGGSTFGNIAVVDLTSGERLAFARSNYCPTGLKTLSYNMNSHLLFAGSTSGYAHCWDIRTMRSVWETRVSPNVIYTVHHLSIDTSTLAVGGLDGVLRILDQRTGEILSSLVMDDAAISIKSANDNQKVSEKKARSLPQNACLYNVPRSLRPPITCLSVGMKKIVTTHNEKFIRIWRFQDNI
ncbi:F-box/WD-40 repeat-containing protein At3g52030-like isoform X1 [Zingiber officinale]|uniref:F-box/WD-40 repeat-containing protein At3g52030-like isoform X1 n=1 Tax=Zingiber officinale TaxID=94328 RepID=UPI001C4AA6FD|nr:F-box/WD-40 repeat-containing protein At3g52030-like isoform X1 [Zingiber officinale]